MTERKLLIDLGNSRAKWLWAIDGELDLESAVRGDLEDFAEFCRKSKEFHPKQVRLASVAGSEATSAVVDRCREIWGLATEQLQSRARQGDVTSGYEDPASLGVDRWLAIVGAARLHGLPLVVWDLGTASTLDAVDASGQHIGGWILPGPETMLKSLASHTGLRVPATLEPMAARPGHRTSECIIGGVLGAQLGALDHFLTVASDGGGQAARLVVTGGAAATVLPLVDREHVHDPWLVFRGMLVD